MQDANVRTWVRESLVSAEMLESVHALNEHFLELVGERPRHWNSHRRPGQWIELSGQIAPLSAAQRKAAANCPYALFDLRFHDHEHWQMRLRAPAQWGVADETLVDANTLDFVRLALFFAWHVASTATLAAQLLLGMNELTAAGLRGVSIDCLPALAATEAVGLTARWSDCLTYWNALTGAALQPNPAGLRKIQLYGLQLAAASRLA